MAGKEDQAYLNKVLIADFSATQSTCHLPYNALQTSFAIVFWNMFNAWISGKCFVSFN
jgi:hypothetical protein